MKDHTCSRDVVRGDHKHASSIIISEFVKEKYQEINGVGTRPLDIINYMCGRHGKSVSYYKAWKARELALEMVQGTPEDSYAQLLVLASAIIAINPGNFPLF